MSYLTCYKTLGIKPGSTMAEIHRAYKKLALRYHPDRAGTRPEHHAEFCRVTQAYSTLRKAFDLQSETGEAISVCPQCGEVDQLLQGIHGQFLCAACLLAQRRRFLPMLSIKVVRCITSIILQSVALYCLFLSWSEGSINAAIVGLAALLAAAVALSWDVMTSSVVSEK